MGTMFRITCVCALAVFLAWTFQAGLAGAQTNDHLKCYQVKGDQKLKGFLDITTPQFGIEPGCKISKPKLFCAPASKSKVAVVDKNKQAVTPLPVSALPAPGDRICWQVKCPEPFPPDQQVTDQFGTHSLTKFKTKLLCTPAVKGTAFCGDGSITGTEECEPTDDSACPGLCQADCSCGGCPTLTCPSGQFPATGQVSCWDPNGTPISCTGTGHDGDIQAGATLSYVDNGDGTITDLNTGLMWAKKSDDGTIHDKDNFYTWDDAFAVHVAGLNSASFAGYTDWRLPNIKELPSIIDYERFLPAVDPVFNTGCVASCTVTTCSCPLLFPSWSSTSDAIGPSGAWGVSDRFVLRYLKSGVITVRAVRGGL